MLPEESVTVDAFVHDFVTGFLDQVPFNKVMGYELITLHEDCVQFKLPMKDDLVGNYLQGILHGGAISTVIDMTGGTLAMVAAMTKFPASDENEKFARLAKSGTIDLRVDYLRPGKGKEFICTAHLLRCGNKVSVVRIELHNEKQDLIAVGTGSYLCG